MTAREAISRAIHYLRDRKRAYQLAFSAPAGQDVLIDLAKFCRASESCFHDDPRKHAVLEGRREVWLRITQHMRLNVEQLYALYGGQHFQVTQEDNNHD